MGIYCLYMSIDQIWARCYYVVNDEKNVYGNRLYLCEIYCHNM